MTHHDTVCTPFTTGDQTRINRRSLAKGAVGAGVGLALASSHQASAQEPVRGGELRLTLGESSSVNLNPIGITTLDSFYVGSVMYDGLVRLSATWNETEPDLAETWDISDDGKTYTFHLRQNVTWHDGEPFTAADVEFTYNTLLNPGVGSYMAGNLTSIVGAQAYLDGEAERVDGIEIVDDHTIRFVLEAPYTPFINAVLTQHSIIPRHYWQDVPLEELVLPGTWEQGQIGTGPFQFSVYEPDRFLEFVRYDNAWRGSPLLDKVLFVHVGTTPEAMAAALENGDIDYAPVPANEFERLNQVPHLDMGAKPVPNIRSLSCNIAKPYLQDKRVRQAIATAIDRAGINETIMAPMAASLNSILTSEAWQNPDLPAYSYDPDAARALLSEAGWDSSQKIELALYYEDQPHKDAIAFMQQQLAEVGITANVTQVDTSALVAYYYEDQEFDVMLVGLGTSPDPSSLENIFSCEAVWPTGQNAMSYCNERVDELFALGRTTVDEAERNEIYDELQTILADELPWIPFYQLQLVAGFNSRVQNGGPIFFIWNRPYNWSIEQVWVSDSQ